LTRWNTFNKTDDLRIQDVLGAGNNPMVGMTVSVAVAVVEASK
jgi:hypothetical protein